MLVVRRDVNATTMHRKPFAPLVSDINMPSAPTKHNSNNAEETGNCKSYMKMVATAPVSQISQSVVIDMPMEMGVLF